MNKNLTLEVFGRSVKLLSYKKEKKKLRTLNQALTVLKIKMDRKGFTAFQQEKKNDALIELIAGGVDEDSIVSDMVDQLILTSKCLD